MLLLYCLAVFTMLLLYYFYNPSVRDARKAAAAYRFRQIKFDNISRNTANTTTCANNANIHSDALYKSYVDVFKANVTNAWRLIAPNLKYLGLNVAETNFVGKKLSFISTDYSNKIEDNYK